MRVSEFTDSIDFRALAHRLWDFSMKDYSERSYVADLGKKYPNSHWKFLQNIMNGINPPSKWNREPDWNSPEEIASAMTHNQYDHEMYRKLDMAEW